jgi:hypothetical protein
MKNSPCFFGSLLALDHCFDRIVILGRLPLFTRPNTLWYFFSIREGSAPFTKEIGRQHTSEYNRWFDASPAIA